MDLGLDGWVVVLTGASGGIGRALADAFVAEGARLALLGGARTPDLEARVASLPWRDRALCLRADVTDPAALEDALERARERFGRVDACVANAGTWPPEDAPLHALDPSRARRTVEVNLLGTLFTARAFLRALERSAPRDDGHGAAFTAIGSTAGRFGERGHADYAAAKAGLRGLVLTLKNEIVALDPRARANLVEPGWTATDLVRAELSDETHVTRATATVPLHRVGRADEVARVVVALTSPSLASHVTGEFVGVTGGMEGRLLW